MSASHQAPATLPNALSWAERAACKGLDLELFFSEAKTAEAYAKRICRRCPVSEQCLAEAFRAEDASRYGIYGGLTAQERAQLRGQRLRHREGRE